MQEELATLKTAMEMTNVNHHREAFSAEDSVAYSKAAAQFMEVNPLTQSTYTCTQDTISPPATTITMVMWMKMTDVTRCGRYEATT